MSNHTYIGVEIIDLDRIEAIVHGLQNIEKDKSIKEGLRKGAAVFVAGGKRRLRSSMSSPKGITGNLIRSFTIKVKRHKLGALAGFKTPSGSHIWLIDRGTKDRWTKKGQFRGRLYAKTERMQLLGFWSEQTHDEDSGRAVEQIYIGIEKGVNRIMQK